jgi:cytoskeletal protein CcmA (bactofilin family)
MSNQNRTIIGESMKITGEVQSKEEIQLNGELEGKLDIKNRLNIGPKGKAKASISATEVDVSGSIKGNVDASERIVLRKGADLVGDVKTAGIVIEDGAYFKGGIDIQRGEAAKGATSRS